MTDKQRFELEALRIEAQGLLTARTSKQLEDFQRIADRMRELGRDAEPVAAPVPKPDAVPVPKPCQNRECELWRDTNLTDANNCTLYRNHSIEKCDNYQPEPAPVPEKKPLTMDDIKEGMKVRILSNGYGGKHPIGTIGTVGDVLDKKFEVSANDDLWLYRPQDVEIMDEPEATPELDPDRIAEFDKWYYDTQEDISYSAARAAWIARGQIK